MIEEHDRGVLTENLPEQDLKAGGEQSYTSTQTARRTRSSSFASMEKQCPSRRCLRRPCARSHPRT